MRSNESAENYLETILILSKKKPVVRSVDIAEELGFKKSSVSVAMKNLREREMITVRPEGYIYLTDAGQEAYETLRSINAAIADMCFEGMTEEEIDTFLSLLDRMVNNIRKNLGTEGSCCCEERKNNT